MKILFVETRFTYVGHSKSLYENIVKYVNNFEKKDIIKLECFNADSLLNQLIDTLSSNRISIIFIDWIHEYTNLYNLIDEIANKLDIRVFGVANLSFLRAPHLSENTKLSDDFQFLQKFSSLNFVSYDYLLKEISDIPVHFYELRDFIPFMPFDKNSECVFCQDQIDFDSKPVIAILGNLSPRRNLIFFNEFFNKLHNDFNFFIKGNLVDPLDLNMFTDKSKRLYFSGVKFNKLSELYHVVHHLDYLLFDSGRSPEPSGIAELFISYGKSVITPNESYSFLNDLHLRSPESPIIKIDLKKDLSDFNLKRIKAVYNPCFSSNSDSISDSFDKIFSS